MKLKSIQRTRERYKVGNVIFSKEYRSEGTVSYYKKHVDMLHWMKSDEKEFKESKLLGRRVSQ